jgi:hypothetical protein
VLISHPPGIPKRASGPVGGYRGEIFPGSMSNLSASAIVNGPVLGEGNWGSPNLTGRDFNLLDSALGHRWGDWAYGGLVSPE